MLGLVAFVRGRQLVHSSLSSRFTARASVSTEALRLLPAVVLPSTALSDGPEWRVVTTRTTTFKRTHR